MSTPPITIGPFANVPAPGSGVRSDWAQQITHAVVDDKAAQDAHIVDTTAAHNASAIAFAPVGTVASTTVQAAIAEVASDANSGSTALTAHLNDTVDAHDASAVSFVPWVDPGGTGSHLDSINVQAVIEEMAGRLQARVNSVDAKPAGVVAHAVSNADVTVGNPDTDVIAANWIADLHRRYKTTVLVNSISKTGTGSTVEIKLLRNDFSVITSAKVTLPSGGDAWAVVPLLVIEPAALNGSQTRHLVANVSTSTATIGVGAQILIEDIGVS